MTLYLDGLSSHELALLKQSIDLEPEVSPMSQQVNRSSTELMTVTLAISLLKLTPPFLKALSELLGEIRKSRYFTIKLVSPNGSTAIEGAATVSRIEELMHLMSEQK